jgi:predicted MFS family arabinose efflux permease
MLGAMRAIHAALAAVLMIVALVDALTTPVVFVVAGLAGILRPNDLVMRNTLIGETIPRHDLRGALALSRATMDSARVAGALAGASLSAFLGVGLAYVFVTMFYAAGFALTLGVSSGRRDADPAGAGPSQGGVPPALTRPSGLSELIDGLVYVWTTPRVLAAMVLALLVNLTAYPVSGGLLPYVARNVYQSDASGLGWLVAGFSFGALVGSIAMVVTGGPRHAERSMIVGVILWYALLLGFGHVRSMPAGAILLVLAGIVQSVAMISMAVSLLLAAGDRFRARVMGVRTFAVYGLPIGLMASGALVDRIGFPATVTLYCAVGALFTALIGLRWRAHVWRG